MGIFHADVPENSATLKPLVAGRRGVVAAGHPLVAEAGFRIIGMGGNAVDAGVAAVFAASIVEIDNFGIGGECPILIKIGDGPAVAINGAGVAPELATVEFYESLKRDDPRRADVATVSRNRGGTIPSFGPLSALVPSAIDSLLLALKEYGTMSFGEVIQPAIELTEGFPVHPDLAQAFERTRSILPKWPTTQKVYSPRGTLPQQGKLFLQPDLGQTLRSMAKAEQHKLSGDRTIAIEAVRDYVYRGPVAREISDFSKQAGCLLREGDFAGYQARIEQPLTTQYRGIEVCKVSFWSQGPVLLEVLNLLEAFDLCSMGHNSADYVHTVVEAMKLGYADRDAYYGDPEFSSIPAQLISKEYADVRRDLINPSSASAEHLPGDPLRGLARATDEFVLERLSHRNSDHADTTCVNVVDRFGNLFSATPSGAWIPALIAGETGIPLSQRAQSFVLTAGHPNQLAPHKHPRITLTPTLALRGGKPWLAFSTPGGDSQDQTLLQLFLNVIEFGMNAQQAVEAPRFNSQAMYSSFDDHSDNPLVLDVENRLARAVIEELSRRGHKLMVGGPWSNPTAATMVEYNESEGVISAGADVRRHRYAVAW